MMYIYERFQEIIFRTLEPYREGTCLAFSGGVDSSLLACIFEEKIGNPTLLSIYFSEQDELDFTRKAAGILKSLLVLEKINLNELEQGVNETLDIINYDRVALLENCIGFFFIFKYASKYGFKNVLSANGADELFCGYDVFRRKYHEMNTEDLIEKTIRTSLQDKVEIDKLASYFNLNYITPFLDYEIVNFSKEVPHSLKIKNEKDELRKHFIRILARKKGLPYKIVYRRKRSLQYSSGLHKSLRRLARKKGFTNKKGKTMGYESGVKAYIKTLEKQLA